VACNNRSSLAAKPVCLPEYKIAKVNVDQQPELAEAFEVMSIPALFVIKDGQIVNQATGARPKAQLLAMLK
jgi:thioredoxin 1